MDLRFVEDRDATRQAPLEILRRDGVGEKTSETHFAYWELGPTVDHLIPVTRGGADEPDNWMTTCMLRNSAKGNWTLEELGWTLHRAGNLAQWDGLESWFTAYVERKANLKQDRGVSEWCRVIQKEARDSNAMKIDKDRRASR